MKETKSRPIWKTTLIWIAIIWSVFVVIGGTLDLVMFLIFGTEFKLVNFFLLLLALSILIKLGVIEYKKNGKGNHPAEIKKENKDEKIASPIAEQAINSSTQTQAEKQEELNMEIIREKQVESKVDWLSLDKALKLSYMIGIILVAFALFYYFLIRPKQEEKSYANCLTALMDSGKFNTDTINTPIGKSALDICTKSNGAEKIVSETKQKAQDELTRREQERLDQERKKLSPYEMHTIIASNVKLVNNQGDMVFQGSQSFKVNGAIQNNNNFNITKLSLKFILTSDKAGKNKLDEVTCNLKDSGNAFGSDTIFYANSSKVFSQVCIFPDGQWWYSYSINHNEIEKIIN